VEAFVRQPAPRSLPANILRYCDKVVPKAMIYFGLVTSLVAGLSLFAPGLETPGRLAAVLFFAVGATLVFFVGRIRLRAKRLLRHGQLVAGRIEKLEDTGWYSSWAGAIYWLTVRYQAQGQPQQAVCRISGDTAERAGRLAAEHKSAPILYDPAHTQRILFVEDLLNVSSEYEL
jgi:hypothetical protein